MKIPNLFYSLQNIIEFENIITHIKNNLKMNIEYLLIDLSPIIIYKYSQIKNHDEKITENLIIREIINFILNTIIKKLKLPDKLIYLYVSLDGVLPIIELIKQKKKLYMKTVINLLSDDNKELEDELFLPGTNFMEKVYMKLKSNSFLNECKKSCKNLNNIEISDGEETGSGIIKILDIINNKLINKNNIYVCSSNNEIIAPLLFIKTKISILYYNDLFYLFDITKFKKELINYCNSCLTTHPSLVNDDILIIEISYIISIFSNRLIPKIESIIIQEDLLSILNCFIITLIKYKKRLLEGPYNEYKLNHGTLKKFLKQLKKNEIKDINRNYYYSKYLNYGDARINNFKLEIIDMKILIEKIIVKFILINLNLNRAKCKHINPLNVALCIDIKYFYKFFKTKFNDNERNYNFEIKELTGDNIKGLNEDIYYSLLSNIFSAESLNDKFYYFFYNLRKLLDYKELYNTLYGDEFIFSGNLLNLRNKSYQDKVRKYSFLYPYKISDKKLLEDIILYIYLKPTKLPIITNIKTCDTPILYKIKSFDSNNSFHQDYIKNNFNNNNDYLKKYKIDNKLDEFTPLFNPVHPFYMTPIKTLETYNKNIFTNINIISVVKKYITGFEWILNYYINRKTDTTYYYEYSRSPLVNDILQYYGFNKLNFDKKYLSLTQSLLLFLPFYHKKENIEKKINKLLKNKKNKDKIIEFIYYNFDYFLNLDLSTKGRKFDCSISSLISQCYIESFQNKPTLDNYVREMLH